MTTYVARFYDRHGAVALTQTAQLAALLTEEDNAMTTDSEIAALAIAYARAHRATRAAYKALERARATALVEERDLYSDPAVRAAEEDHRREVLREYPAERAMLKACDERIDALFATRAAP